MHSYFSCNDFSLNLLMQVDVSDEKREDMLKELDAFLSMTRDRDRFIPSSIIPVTAAHFEHCQRQEGSGSGGCLR